MKVTPEKALDHLYRLLCEGTLSAQVRNFKSIDLKHGLGISINEYDIPSEVWRECSKDQILASDGGRSWGPFKSTTSVARGVKFRARDLTFDRVQLLACIDGSSPTHPTTVVQRKGSNRKGDYDWEACMIELAAHVHLHGLPSKQADLIEVAAGLFGEAGPGETQLKAHVAKFYNRLKTL